jgi:hypothetical protein
LLFAVLVSAATLWKWPRISLFVAWLNLLLIVTHFSPWNDDSAKSFLHGFLFDHLFFIAANVGAFAVFSLKRSQPSEV